MDYKEGVGLLDEAEDEDDGRASPINRAIVPQNSNQVGLLCWCCIHLYLIFSQFFFMLTQSDLLVLFLLDMFAGTNPRHIIPASHQAGPKKHLVYCGLRIL